MKLKKQIADAEAESKRQEEQYLAEVKRLQDDIERRATLHKVLKKDLEGVLLEKAKVDKQLNEAKNALSDRAANDQKLKAICDENDAKTKKAESELAELKAQSAEWLKRLASLNREMDRKPIRIALITESPFPGCLLTILAFFSCRRVHPVSEASLRRHASWPSRKRERPF